MAAPACLRPPPPLQELCELNLAEYLPKVAAVMYDSSAAPRIPSLAPLLTDICKGTLYLHSRNLVHGGR